MPIRVGIEAEPATPSSGFGRIFVDSVKKILGMKNDAGVSQLIPLIKRNFSVAAQGAGFSSDTYLTGSNVAFPSGFPIVGTRYRLTFDVTKSGAGTATPIITIRIGTAGAIGDTARLTFTFNAGTANADTGRFEIECIFRTVGSGTSAVLQGRASLIKGATATTGLVNLVGQALQVTSGGFDSTVAGSIIGASVNGGTSASWTVQLVEAELMSL